MDMLNPNATSMVVNQQQSNMGNVPQQTYQQQMVQQPNTGMMNNQGVQMQTGNGSVGQVTFTPEQQAFVNYLISNRVNETKAKYNGAILPNTPEYQAYAQFRANRVSQNVAQNNVTGANNIQSNTQNAVQLSEAQKSIDALTQQLIATQKANNQYYIQSLGVNPQFAEFVMYNAEKNVSDTISFQQSVNTFLAQNPQYLTIPQNSNVTMGTTQNTANAQAQQSVATQNNTGMMNGNVQPAVGNYTMQNTQQVGNQMISQQQAVQNMPNGVFGQQQNTQQVTTVNTGFAQQQPMNQTQTGGMLSALRNATRKGVSR